jgi:two-component system sensor histidine kinase TctE
LTGAAPTAGRAARSLRATLLAGILLPVLAFVAVGSWLTYRQALQAADVAYDRTLLASAKSIGELLDITVDAQGRARLTPNLPYAALEAFEADNRSRMYFKVTGFDGEVVAGFEDLPPWHGTLPVKGPYAALVHFYDERYHGEPVRMAVLLQPVASPAGLGTATIQIAETLELRQTLARQLLVASAWRQALLVALIALVVVVVVRRATRPVLALSAQLQARSENDLTPLPPETAPGELQPMVVAVNAVMARLAHLLAHQKRFVRDASHQLRTPLAVLTTQVQSARRGDVESQQALREIEHTVAGATRLANQMLALAKVEQLRQQHDAPVTDWAEAVRAVALDLAPLVAERGFDFALDVEAAPVRAHDWALRELTRNLLHNAVKYGRPDGMLHARLAADAGTARLTVSDQGPGLDPELRRRLFDPFARGVNQTTEGTGLGLAICREVAGSLGGTIALRERVVEGRVDGLDAVVELPLAEPAHEAAP